MLYRLVVFKVEGYSKTPIAVHYYSNKYDMTCDIEEWIDNSQDDIFYEFRKLVNNPFDGKL